MNARHSTQPTTPVLGAVCVYKVNSCQYRQQGTELETRSRKVRFFGRLRQPLSPPIVQSYLPDGAPMKATPGSLVHECAPPLSRHLDQLRGFADLTTVTYTHTHTHTHTHARTHSR